jgi:hypothetical protein
LPTLLQVEGAKAAREIARSVGSSCDIHGGKRPVHPGATLND